MAPVRRARGRRHRPIRRPDGPHRRRRRIVRGAGIRLDRSAPASPRAAPRVLTPGRWDRCPTPDPVRRRSRAGRVSGGDGGPASSQLRSRPFPADDLDLRGGCATPQLGRRGSRGGSDRLRADLAAAARGGRGDEGDTDPRDGGIRRTATPRGPGAGPRRRPGGCVGRSDAHESVRHPSPAAPGATVLGASLRRLLSLASSAALVAGSLPLAMAPAALAAPASCGSGDGAGRATAHHRRARLRDRDSAGELQLHHQRRQHEAARAIRWSLSTESNSPIVARGRPEPPDGHPARRALPGLGALARPQDVGRVLHPARRRRRQRHAHRARRPDRAERGQSAAARQDPRLRVQRQRLDERRPGHRRGRAGRLQGRAGGADRQRGHRRLQQRPAVRRRSA